MKLFCKHVFKLIKKEYGTMSIESGSVILGNYRVTEELMFVSTYKCLLCGKVKREVG